MGDADAASGKDGETISSLSEAELKRTMHGADLWRRSATVAAGPVFNFILSILVFAGIFLFSGTPTEDALIGKLKPNPGNEELFQEGDLITSIGATEINDIGDFYQVAREVPPAQEVPYQVLRDGQAVEFDSVFPMPPVLDQLQPQSAAIDAGLAVGDVITSVDGTPVWALSQVQEAVQAGAGASVQLSVWRDGETLEVTLTPRQRDLPVDGGFETRWLIGFFGWCVL